MPSNNTYNIGVLSDNELDRISDIIISKIKNRAPSHLKSVPDALSPGLKLTPSGNYIIKFWIPLNSFIAKSGEAGQSLADARAQEYGSGLRGRGNRHKYIIKPKSKNILAFHWEVNSQTGQKVDAKVLARMAYYGTSKKVVYAFKSTRVKSTYKNRKGMTIDVLDAVRRVQKINPDTNKPVFDHKGNPVMVDIHYRRSVLELTRRQAQKLKLTSVYNNDFAFNYVEHPGIRPYKGEGYLRAGFRDALPEFKLIYNKAILGNITLQLRTSFKNVKL